ncbi:helix-turn-helix domain-containing protein [Streptomyces sasae]|uniref:helix-turn-helix domain-containing protein n=1 Tax=Streptomyces sasae TaxID=1266772 RepID=UPI00292ED093|nr:helix-turn-helix transcriptional regulator [Streptomyces sasae]
MSAWDGDDRGKVPVRDDVEEFAALLRQLKDRTDRSYGSLARRLHMNTSTLHRYCAGDAVPQDFAPVERLAAFCGAAPEERLELHERWLRAVAARQRPRAAASGPDGPTAPERTGSEEGTGEETVETAEGKAEEKVRSKPDPAPVPLPWYHRRRTLVAAAAGAVLLATLGTLAALPGDRSTTDAASRLPGSAPTAAAGGPERHGTSSTGPSSSPTSPTPSSGGTKPSSPADPGTPTSTAVPLTWTADSQLWELGCDHDYVIDKQPAQVPPPPAPQDAGPWAATQNAVHGGNTIVDVSVQGRSSTAVVLEDLRVRVVGRTTPAPGIAYSMADGCGGGLTPRYFDVDLDKDRPIARPVAGEGPDGKTVSTMHLPYRVSATDPEVLRVTANTAGCDCRWYLELDWSSQGRSGTVRIDDHGRPFRTSSIKGLKHYWYGSVDGVRQWVPVD